MPSSVDDKGLAVKWVRNLISNFPKSLDDLDDAITETLDDLGELVDEIDDGDIDFDAERLNRLVLHLKGELEELEDLGAKKSPRDKFCKKLIKNGWAYWVVSSQVPMKPISTKKGDSSIKYTSWSFDMLEAEFVTIESDVKSLIWDVIKLDLDNQPSVYMASIPAWQLDMVSRVPAIEKKISHRETSKRVLDQNRKKDSWQRQLNSDNKASISSFFDSNEAFFANPVILHSTNEQFVTFNGGTCKISLEFCSNNELGSMDSSGIDKRPFTIIDGQHRVRGAANSAINYSNRLLVVILPPSLADWKAGKLFAEINTLSKELDPKHRLFLAHRFNVSSPDALYNFAKYDGTGKTERARANRMSYDLAAKMLLKSEFWVKKIKILKQNTEQQQVLDIEKWLKYSYVWFTSYPYTSARNLGSNELTQEVLNYFYAWHKIIGEDNWDNSKLGKCLFKSKTQARILLTRFQQCYELSDTTGIFEDTETPIKSVNDFLKVLEPISNVPMLNETILDKYSNGATPENSWKMLDAWVRDALKDGSVHSKEMILDTEQRGIPGAGIISRPPKPENWTVEFDPALGLDPIDGVTKYIKVTRPNNCHFSCKPEVWHDDTRLSVGISVKSKSIEDSANLPIRHKKEIENNGRYILKVVWTTIAGDKFLELEIANRTNSEN